MCMFGDKCSPISKWLFPCSTMASEPSVFSLLESTPISQKFVVQNQKYTEVQDLYEFSDFGGSTELRKF